MNVYQLWLDDLYPRAKFADGLAIIEKLGHTKRMQTMRREWINESKPRDNFENPGNAIHELKAVETSTKTEQGHSPEAGSKDKSSTPVAVVTDDDELYMATPKRRPDEGTSNRNLASTESLFVTDEEPDDDLDELLNQTKDNPASYTALPEEENTSRRRQDDFEDELEAIASLNDMW